MNLGCTAVLQFNDWLHSSSLLIFTTLELFFWWRVRKVGKAWKRQHGCNGRVINCLQQFSCIQQNPLQPQNCCYSGQSYIILQKCALFANMLARYAHMKLHWQLQTDTTFQQLLLFGGSILCSLLLRPAVFAAQYQTGQRIRRNQRWGGTTLLQMSSSCTMGGF